MHRERIDATYNRAVYVVLSPNPTRHGIIAPDALQTDGQALPSSWTYDTPAVTRREATTLGTGEDGQDGVSGRLSFQGR